MITTETESGAIKPNGASGKENFEDPSFSPDVFLQAATLLDQIEALPRPLRAKHLQSQSRDNASLRHAIVICKARRRRKRVLGTIISLVLQISIIGTLIGGIVALYDFQTTRRAIHQGDNYLEIWSFDAAFRAYENAEQTSLFPWEAKRKLSGVSLLSSITEGGQARDLYVLYSGTQRQTIIERCDSHIGLYGTDPFVIWLKSIAIASVPTYAELDDWLETLDGYNKKSPWVYAAIRECEHVARLIKPNTYAPRYSRNISDKDSPAGPTALVTGLFEVHELQWARQFRKATDKLRRLCNEYPRNEVLWHELAGLLIESKQCSEAESALQALEGCSRERFRYNALRGDYEADCHNDRRTAEAAYEEALKEFPAYHVARINLLRQKLDEAVEKKDRDRWIAIIKDFEAMVAQLPTRNRYAAYARFSLAHTLSDPRCPLFSYARAIRLYEASCDSYLGPTSIRICGDYIRTFADMWAESGEPPTEGGTVRRILDVGRDAIRGDPGNASNIVALIKLLLCANEIEEAQALAGSSPAMKSFKQELDEIFERAKTDQLAAARQIQSSAQLELQKENTP